MNHTFHKNTGESLLGNEQMFKFSEADFNSLRKLINTHTGISLADHKTDLVYGRLSKRLRALGLNCFGEYCDLLQNHPDNELEHFTNAITTNLTGFFREAHHFEYLAKQVVPLMMKRYRKTKRLRIWSAGCSTGEEAYSLAITLREAIPDIDQRDIRILATDLDSNVVQMAASGIYQEKCIEGLDAQRIRRWFRRGTGSHAGKVKVVPALQRMITFRQLNLMQDWPMQGMFDVIFCRNVVIYFDKPTQSKLFERFAKMIHPEGHLFIGHSETLTNISNRYQLVDKTIYRRTC